MAKESTKISASIRAVSLVRSLFEHIHGNLGVLKFSIEELKPTNGSPSTESQKWDVICSFFKTLGASSPTRYLASVNLKDMSVTIKELSGGDSKEEKFTFSSDSEEKKESASA
jgi:hypothetical protein